ncbi:hypothetical protein IL38_22025 [Actinopolyspora erythraea]|uniref:Uncharacterized protein n=1 Tax=Actinopolyspora erythraea TaxID=414996 RepID=A0ABR4WZ76_9ACTN|nr:hypothetical protein IL38_22025 [Actinopolyspora erythraea]
MFSIGLDARPMPSGAGTGRAGTARCRTSGMSTAPDRGLLPAVQTVEDALEQIQVAPVESE